MPAGPDIKAYADAIGRVSQALSLASLLPVAWELRFSVSARSRFLHPPRPGADQAAAAGDTGERARRQGRPSARVRGVPLGMLSVLLFLASELVVSRDVFKASPSFTRKMEAIKEAEAKMQEDYQKKSKGKGKPKKFKHEPVYPDGPIGALLKGIGDGQKKAAKSAGTLETFGLVVDSALESAEAFATAHAIMMLTGLTALSLAMVAQSWYAGLKAPPIAQCLVFAVPVLLFGACRRPAMLKLWKAAKGTAQLLPALRLPLRVAGLVAAAPPPDEDDDEEPSRAREATTGTPPLFACLQAASLAALLSSEAAKGELPKAIADFSRKPSAAAMLDSNIASFMIPLLLTLVWVAVRHLRQAPGSMLLTTLLVGLTTPAVVVQLWPKAVGLLGAVMGPVESVKTLVGIVSLIYTIFSFATIVVGGTMGIMATLLMGQLLAYIHGEDALKLLVPGS